MIASAPRLVLAALFALSLAAHADTTVLGTRTLVDHGDPSNRYDIVFVGDGYRQADQEEFRRAVDRAVALMRTTSPFKEYWAYLNVHRVDVASRDRGVTQKGKVSRNTAFDVVYGGTFRYLQGDREQIQRVVTRHAPDADAIVCLFPDLHGGASFGKICFAAAHQPDTVVHELGHSIGRVADEYDGRDIKLPAFLIAIGETLGRPILCAMGWRFNNISRLRKRSKLPWAHWISPSTPIPTPSGQTAIGLYEGALNLNHGVYRPHPNCLMRRGDTFCAVCREELTLAVSAKVMPYTWTAKRVAPGMQLGFKTLVPGPVKARWFSGENEVAQSHSVRVASNGRLRLEVADATRFVRRDTKDVLVHSRTWTLSDGKVSGRTDGHRSFGGPKLQGDWLRARLLNGMAAQLPN